MPSLWFPDNTVLCNFAAVGQLRLLRDLLDGRGRWTEAVAREAAKSARWIPAMADIAADGWLGTPIEISAPDAERIEAIRVAALGGSRDAPLRHLGEAQTCFYIKERAGITESVWITDDEAAYDYGKRIGLLTWDTTTVLAHIVSDGVLSAADALALLRKMQDADRNPRRIPAKPGDLA